ncbi:MAG: hypothetical protein HYV09_15635 [Deltaproteobacteria bacterium]|nr:hypothetical protein [Deltaproteobacteria bacterium]
MGTPATPDDYYDHTPEPGHATGDIWCGLPSYGALKQEHVAGIVVTPACDLQNSKSETITYLPILSFDAWFATFSALTDIRSATQNYCRCLFEQAKGEPFTLSSIPAEEELAALLALTESLPDDGKFRARVLAGIGALKAIVNHTTLKSDISSLVTLFSQRDFVAKCERLVTNALRSDTHFLPARGRWAVAAVADDSFASHSLVMFRYPLTAPLDILNLANAPNADWSAAIAEYAPLPAARFFQSKKPVRVARLRPRFFADLLSRYTGLYARVGSPDFAPSLVTTLAEDICGIRKA